MFCALVVVLFATTAFSRTAFATPPNTIGISSAVIQNSTQSTVDIVISGSNYNQFFDNHDTTADSTDLSHIHYNGNTPTIATMSGTTITATFPISVGTYKSGGSLTISANTLDRSSLAHNTSTLTITNSNITDNAKPVVVISDVDGSTLDASTSSPQAVQITFSEPVTIPTVSVSPDGSTQTVTDCGDSNATTWCFNYSIPSSTTATETITISDAQDLASSPNTMDSDSNHTFTVSPYENMLDIVGDMVNAGSSQVEIVIPSTGPTLTSFWYSGTVTASGTDLSQITYNGVNPARATIDTENNALDLFFNIADGFQTTPQGDIDIQPGTVVANLTIGNSEDYVPQELITDDAAPVLTSGYAENSGGDSPTTQVIFTMSENLVDVDNGTVSHPNFTIKNATTGQSITVTAADISGGGDNSFYLNLDTSDPDDYAGPLTFSYDTGAEGTQMLDNSGNYTTSITDFPVNEADSGYHTPTIDSGSGTPSDPYRISTCAGIADINNHLSSSFLLTADADCTNQGNNIMVGTDGGPFTGTFDGGGHTVTISINDSVYSAGLFRRADGATITNVILTGGVNGFSSVGALVGWASNTNISYVGSTANVSTGGAGNLGGLVGIDTAGSTISNSYSTGNVTGGDDAGGILGQGNGSHITNVYATGTISGGNNVGGIIGRIANGGSLTYSFSAAAISGSSSLGALIGEPNTVFTREDYFDATASTLGPICYGNTDNDPYCNPENVGGGDSMYFKNNSSNTPLADWDFTNVWTTTANYPVFQTPIHVAPSKVLNLTHTSEDSSSVNLSWDAPMYNIDAVTDYVIEYSIHGENSWSTFAHDPFTSTTATVTGLSSGTDYDFRVSAVNSIGTGPTSDTTEDTTSGGGGGSSGDISSCADFENINNNLSGHYTLTADLLCGGEGNNIMVGSYVSPFTGTFNGQGHTITISIDDPIQFVGLFGATEGATITNLQLAGSVTGVGTEGALVGYADGGTHISFVGSTANVTDTSGGDTGGLVGQLIGGSSVSNSYSQGTISSPWSAVGGLVGYMNTGATVDRSYATGSVTAGTNGSVGGLIGYNFEPSDTVTNSFSAGAVTGSGDTVSGFFGYTNGATLTNDYFDANRSGQAHCIQYSGDACTAVNGDGSNPTYFLDNSSSAPLDSWDFTNIWNTASDSYPVLRSDAHTVAVSVSITTPADGSVALANNWHPVVDFGIATTCQYAYGSDSYQTVTCSNNGSDIPVPTGSDFASATLHIKGSADGQTDGTASATFFYYQTAQTTPTGGPNFTWTHQSGWSGGIALHMARSADGSKVIASADIGDVHTSTDGGVSWNDQTSLGNHQWNSVAMSATGQFMLASIYGGDTYLSSDSGSNWTDVGTLSGGPGSMSGGAYVAMSADGKYMYIAGSGYDLYRSENSGASWQLLTTGDNGWGGLAASADGKYLAALNGGNLYTSSDYGNTFSSASGVPGGNLNALGLSADGSTIAVGGWHGDVGVSRDFGSTWNDETALGDHFWYGFGLSADGSVIAAGVNYDSSTTTGPMYISTDGGNTFTAQTNVINDNWQSFGVSADGTQILAYGNNSGLSSLGSSGGGGGGGSGTVGYAKITVKDISGNPISGATVQVACPYWGSFSSFGTTDGSGVVEANPCGGGENPIAIQVTADGYYSQNSQYDLSYDNTVDPENEIGGSTANQYSISLVPDFDGTGSGTSEDPYIITNCTQLNAIDGNLSAYYQLNAPDDTIDCSGIDFQPIGQTSDNGFTGTLEGRGLDGNITTVTNLTINQPNIGNIGVFAKATGATIKDIIFSSGSVAGGWDVGGLIGDLESDGDLENISSNLSVSADNDWDEGGMVGYADMYNSTTNDFSNLTYTGSMDINQGGIGGIFGDLEAYNTDTYVTMDHDTVSGGAIGSYTSGSSEEVGGLIGYLYVDTASDGDPAGLEISNALVSSTVSSDNGYETGGLIGYARAEGAGGTSTVSITNSSVTNTVSGGSSTGGLIGSEELDQNGGNITFTIDHDSVTQDVTGTGGDIGGFVGHIFVFNSSPILMQASFTNSSVTGNVTGDSEVGGLIGGTEGEGPGVFLTDPNGTGGIVIQNDYATGNITGNVNNDGGDYAGGLVGLLACYSNNASNPYACSISSSYAAGNVSGYQYVGGAVGYDYGDTTIGDIYSRGNVSGNSQVGGLVGYADASTNLTIDRTYASGVLTISGDSPQDVGGLVGQFGSDGTITFGDSFSAVDLSDIPETTNLGWLIGDSSTVTPTNLWYATISDGELPCVGDADGSSFCTSESSGSFFQNSTTNGPLSNWDFTSAPVWIDHNADYPTLTGNVYVPPAPTVSITTPADSSTVTTWSPIVDWGNSTTCDYSYGDSDATNRVSCHNGGSDIPVPDTTGSQTLNIQGSNGGGSSSLISSTFTYNPDIPSEVANTSAYWKMDETTQGSTVVDSSTNESNGTVSGSPTPSSDNPGLKNIVPDTESLNFNSETNDKVDVSNASNLDMNGSFSIAFWMKPTTWNDDQSRGIISKFNPDSDRGFIVYDDGSSNCNDSSCGPLLNLRAHGDGGTQDYLHSTASVDIGSWQHWAIVYNTATHTVKIYKNGELDTTYTGITIGDASNSTDLSLGYSQPWSGYFDGNLDDFRLYQNALTPSDVAYLAATGESNVPVLTQVTPIASTITVGSPAVYTFSVSGDVTGYSFEVGECNATATMDSAPSDGTHTLTLSDPGMGVGSTHNCTIDLHSDSGPQSNTLTVGPFTVIAAPNGGGGGGGGGSSGGSTIGGSSSAGCVAGVTCPSTTGTTTHTTTPTPASAGGGAYHFPRQLKQNVKPGNDVTILQKFLNTHGFPIAKSGPGSKGKETKTFGPATKAALMKFQKANKITPVNGILGPKTKAAIEKVMNK